LSTTRSGFAQHVIKVLKSGNLPGFSNAKNIVHPGKRKKQRTKKEKENLFKFKVAHRYLLGGGSFL